MSDQMDLRSFKIPLGKLAPLEKFRTRQGDTLTYRFYPAWCEDLVILYHGAGSDSRYMCVLADAIAKSGVANVVTPDLRGHGGSLNLNTDTISQSQLEIDMEELLIHIKMQRSISRLTLAGHSMGGGFTLRIATSALGKQFYKFVALAPHLPDHLQTNQPGYGGWITAGENGSFNVNFPEAMRTGNERLHYSAQYLKAVHAPDDVMEKIKALHPNLYVVTGGKDEVINAEKQKELFAHTDVKFLLLESLNHISIVSKVDGYLSVF
ncbi:alpha/beta hydrolase [Bdellovibrio sp. NC01]|uniref:alpha/beta hydrolase n=1 Tax=Bdellovibrio sp. NC01 TaxID=2220073 RepID=UPI001158366D|nr:alpha/beta fold hydrolase [Bdellovibrio sp. NC01]QDK37280.1 lysophospholipase [Bdellovibrio sp. NC01]